MLLKFQKLFNQKRKILHLLFKILKRKLANSSSTMIKILKPRVL
jgi:hypothetical protein